LVIVVVLALATPLARAAGGVSPSAENPATGQKLYVAKCARCHKFYDPAAYDDARWRQWMEKMRDKARLNEVQYKQLSEYLRLVRTKAAQKTSISTKP
jgi:mono/diheme cytochrome c family protein